MIPFATIGIVIFATGLGPLNVVACGMLAGVASMLIYWRLSPQARISQTQVLAAEARHQLNRFDGDDVKVFASLAKRAFGLSFQHLGLVLLPTLVAIIPVLLAAFWMENLLDHSAPLLLNFGPHWLRSGHTIFWLSLGLAALSVKLRFGIK